MALYHFSVSQIKRSAGQSVLAAAAYRAGERLYSEYYDEISDYTRKGGVLHTEILLPAHAPERFRDRATLWNAVEAAERHPKAQLAYSFDIALQNELSLNENIELARFRAKGICGSRNDRRPCHSFSRQDRRHSQSPHAHHDHHASIES